MKSITRVVLISALGFSSIAFAQVAQVKQQRRPELSEPASSPDATKPSGVYFSILNGVPLLFELHHDTEVGTNKPVDVYLMQMGLQVMNSDGGLEPPLAIDIFFTASPQDPASDVNPHNARDCRIWNGLILKEIKTRDSKSPTWPYLEFIAAEGARVLKTNEDGSVYWSDDIECWGSQDRFPPF
jgi:hypothetical protein